jgi:hypothetical protein
MTGLAKLIGPVPGLGGVAWQGSQARVCEPQARVCQQHAPPVGRTHARPDTSNGRAGL